MTVTRWDVMGGNIGRVTGRSVVLTRRRKKNAAQFRECRRHAAFARTDPLALALLSRSSPFTFKAPTGILFAPAKPHWRTINLLVIINCPMVLPRQITSLLLAPPAAHHACWVVCPPSYQGDGGSLGMTTGNRAGRGR